MTGTALPTDDECRIRAKAARDARLKEVALRSGEAGYNAFASVYNNFIDIIKQEVTAITAVLEPLITIDKFVYNNFVEPQLSMVKEASDVVKRTIKIPAQVIGAVSSACPKAAKNQVAVNKVEKFATQDIDKLKNKADRFKYFLYYQEEVLQALQDLPDSVDGLKAPSYSEFIKTI